MHLLLIGGFVLALVFGPGIWVRRVMERYSEPADRYQGTGADLACHLLRRFGLADVRVERSEAGDHYDPDAKAVRLTPGNYDGRSLTAITIAAHEVGHALQDHQGFGPLRWRTRLVAATRGAERLGAALLMASPFLGMFTRAPSIGLISFLGGFLSLGSAALVHMVTLPTEFDASFVRALPILRDGYLKKADRPHARRILMAAALTYVAASLTSLLNIARWWALLLRR